MMFVDIRAPVGLLVLGDAQEHDRILCESLLQLNQPWRRHHARRAPRTPEVQQHRLALQILERDVLALKAGKAEVRRESLTSSSWILDHADDIARVRSLRRVFE